MTGAPPIPAAPSELGSLSATLAAAFNDDPVFGWLLPDTDKRRDRLVEFFTLELRAVVFPSGQVWTSVPTLGASLELPPGQWKMPVATQIRHGRAFVRVFGTRLPRATVLLALMERRHIREPHYYIPYVGVAPSAQGQGLGTALLRQTLNRCDREGLPAYLEATHERNAALYERLGFQVIDELRLGQGPPLWPMLRQPSARDRSTSPFQDQ